MTIYELSLKKQPTQIPKRTGTNYFLGTYFKMTGSLFDGYLLTEFLRGKARTLKWLEKTRDRKL
jgi:hypothetical protein